MTCQCNEGCTDVFFDDFNRADSIDDDIGLSSSGHSYVISGSGASSSRIVRGGLQLVSPRETAYFYPQIDFIPAAFGTRFILANNPDAVSESYVYCMLVGGSPNGLEPMIHILWNNSNISVEKWPGGGPANKVNIFQRIFATPLQLDGPSYVTHLEFYPERDEIVLFPPDGSKAVVLEFPDLSTYLTPYICFETGEVDTSVALTRWEAAWAWPRNEVRMDWGGGARAEFAKALATDALLGQDGKIASAFMPLKQKIVEYDTDAFVTLGDDVDVALNTFDMSSDVFKVWYLPLASAVPFGKTVECGDLSGTLSPGVHFIVVSTQSPDVMVGGSENNDALHRLQKAHGAKVEFTSNGVDRWVLTSRYDYPEV